MEMIDYRRVYSDSDYCQCVDCGKSTCSTVELWCTDSISRPELDCGNQVLFAVKIDDRMLESR